MGAIQTARQNLADSLGAVEAITYAFPPANVTPPAVVIVPREPYLEMQTIGKGVRVTLNLDLHFVVQTTDNPGPLDILETNVMTALGLLPNNTVVGPVGRPQLTQINKTQMLVSILPVAVTVENA